MGIPLIWKNYFSKLKQVIIKRHEFKFQVDSVSIDLNGLLHKAFQMVFSEHILQKAEHLIKDGTKLIADFKGKKVYVSLGFPDHFFLRYLAKKQRICRPA